MRELDGRRSIAIPLAAFVAITVVSVGAVAHQEAARPFTAAVDVSTLLVGAMVLAVVFLVPWRRLPAPKADQLAAFVSFPPAQLRRVKELERATKVLSRLARLIALPINLIVGLTPAGSIAIGRMAEPFGGSQAARVIVGAFALTLVDLVIGVPFGVWGHRISKRFGLTSQGWGGRKGWVVDQLKGLAMGTVLSAIILTIIYGAMNLWPHWWWLGAMTLLIAFVLGYTFVYPVTIARFFNKYTPLPDGPLRTRLLELAAQDGVKVRKVVVADASRRTNMTNAAVMGYGRTRKILLYDTLLKPSDQVSPLGNVRRAATDDEIACIIGHELAHAKYRDILAMAFVGMAQTCLMFCALYLLGNWHWLLHWIQVDSITDGRALFLVLTVFGYWSLLFNPLNSLIGRRIEAAGDWHSLLLTRNPTAMESAWHQIAEINLANPKPGWFEYFMYATHPSIVKRIAMARAFARRMDVPEAVPAPTP